MNEPQGTHGVDFEVYDLTCGYAVNPIGIDNARPLLSWKMRHGKRGQGQSAYRIIVSSNLNLLGGTEGDLWDSGKVLSAQSAGIAYAGRPLSSGQACCWKVKAWDLSDKEGEFGEPATFEMGLLLAEDWRGSWLGHAGGFNGSSVLMRKAFRLDMPLSKVARARAYVSGLGYYELRLNGSKVGDHVLDPGATDYSKRILYCSYDVGEHFAEGDNVIGLLLGNGWYGAPKAIVQMNIDYADGTRQEVCTKWDWGEGWQISRGPIIRNSIFDGEVYDARLEKDGWDTAAYDIAEYDHKAGGWITASSLESPGGRLVSQTMEPIKVVDELHPVNTVRIANHIVVYDIGQNVSGWAKIAVRGAAGAVVSMKYAESLYDNGTVNQENLRLAEAKDTYILRGAGRELYAPRFTYHGFRYVQVEIVEGEAHVETLAAQIVRSAVSASGTFRCSDELVNRIHRNVWWTEAGNLHSIPTDCPQRDERMAWLNDATARAEQAFYNFDMARFYDKWLNDIADTQDAHTGAIADTAPYRWGFRPADPLVSCYLTIPMLLYRYYGNRDVLVRHYEGMKAWTDHLAGEAESYIIHRSYYGDWASPVVNCDLNSNGDGAVSTGTPGALVSTAFFYLNARLLSRMAAILGKQEDVAAYRSLAERIQAAFNGTFLDKRELRYASGGQGANAIALGFGLVPSDSVDGVLRNLMLDIERTDGHLSTGNQGTKPMLEALAALGQVETAYRIVTKKTYPGWGFMIENGATTIWERWEYDIGNKMNSRNHPMHANVGSWFYKVLAGIEADEEACGFDRFRIKPYPAGDLQFAAASMNTVKGLVEVNWSRRPGSFELHAEIPANSAARVCLVLPEGAAADDKRLLVTEGGRRLWSRGQYEPGTDGIYGARIRDGRIELEVGSGRYAFKVELDEEE